MSVYPSVAAVPGTVRRPSLLRRLWLPAAVAAPVVAAMGYVAAVDPNQPGHYPRCFLLSAFGIYCPGCGGLRSVHALTHGDLLAALQLNGFGIALIVASTAVWSVWLVARLRLRPIRGRWIPATLFTLLALLPVFAVVRNLPFGQFLAP